MNEDKVNEIKGKMRVVEVVGEYVQLKKKGSSFVGICPFHNEKTPSFSVQPKGTYKCFGCGKQGDSIQFLVEYLHKSYIDALLILAEKYGVEIGLDEGKKEYKIPPPPRLEKMSKETIEYFEKHRGISNNTLLRLKVTDGVEYMPTAKAEIPVIMFNYFQDEKLVNIKYRGKGKDFKSFSGGKLIFYNLDSIKDQKVVVIGEGEIESLTFHECGFYSNISVPNGGGAGKNNLEYLDNCYECFNGVERIILATDGDFVGKNLQKELGRRLGLERCYQISYPTEKVVMDKKTGVLRACKDPNEVLVHLGKEAVKAMINEAKEWPIEGILTGSDLEADIDDYWENGFPSGDEAGIDGLDELIKFEGGQFTIITGVPNMGKSEFIDNILASLVKKFLCKVGIVSFENRPAKHATKIMQKLSGKSFQHRLNPNHKMSQNDYNTAKALIKDFFFFVDGNEINATMTGILEKMDELVKRKGIKYFLIDPWNYIEQNITPGMTETNYTSKVLSELKRFLRLTDTHCFLIAHPTKMRKENGKYEVPNLYSISGSQNFFSKTDNGMTVHIDGNVFVYIQKIRDEWNGRKGYVEFFFDTMTRQYIPLNVDGIPIIKKDNEKRFKAPTDYVDFTEFKKDDDDEAALYIQKENKLF